MFYKYYIYESFCKVLEALKKYFFSLPSDIINIKYSICIVNFLFFYKETSLLNQFKERQV